MIDINRNSSIFYPGILAALDDQKMRLFGDSLHGPEQLLEGYVWKQTITVTWLHLPQQRTSKGKRRNRFPVKT